MRPETAAAPSVSASAENDAFDVIYSPDTRALVHEARHAQHDATPDSTGQTKKPSEIGGLSLEVLSDQFIALVEGSSKSIMVDVGGLNQNTWRQIQRVAATWEKAKERTVGLPLKSSMPEFAAITEPSRRARTPLTPSEVESIRTLHAAGVSEDQLAKQFGVHRSIVWGKTRQT